MLLKNFNAVFSRKVLDKIISPGLSDKFFEALYGDPDEGAYEISLAFKDFDSVKKALFFELELHERPGKCLACNLTYGLPEVFSRHPLININGFVKKIETLLGGEIECDNWELGRTRILKDNLHAIALTIWLA